MMVCGLLCFGVFIICWFGILVWLLVGASCLVFGLWFGYFDVLFMFGFRTIVGLGCCFCVCVLMVLVRCWKLLVLLLMRGWYNIAFWLGVFTSYVGFVVYLVFDCVLLCLTLGAVLWFCCFVLLRLSGFIAMCLVLFVCTLLF